ncbi:hypothetical protein HN51_009037 [Arachis hypogaea]|uniref:DUF4408 domain-containing protein n=1 Tax=Arachis hypogaea TaxID=3818 RepID=A0A445D118_ARAHY|nr:uncharacterized protein LOC112802450 [Arachis hypogaea]QHO43450.1 uncharacterized protein DS421_5g162930 [Arachis hypogaea]RYR56861.1 hypothetical protein Ahy_A05g022578 [Arachis hypogaea]
MDLFQNPSCIKSKRLEAGLWVAKLVLMMMGVVSLLFLLKVAIIPYTFDLLLSTLPRLWTSARSWLTLPFVYIIVNFIIITIAASSNFSHQSIPFSSATSSPKKTDADSDSDATTTVSDTPTNPTTHPVIQNNEPPNQQEKEVIQHEEEEEKEVEVVDADYDYDKLRALGLSFEKILTSPSLEKCTNDYFLPESDEKGDDHDHDDDHDDTLEATWRAIMEGQGKTMKPQLKKSDTWSGGARISKAEPFQRHNNGQGYGGGDDDDPVTWAQKELRKSETFNDRASLRREKSMTPEELNLRAEAFIKNFNNQMKLQRLESYQRYMKMVNGRA